VRVSEKAEVARQAAELSIRERPDLRSNGIELVRALAYPTHLAVRFRWQSSEINIEIRADEWWHLPPVVLSQEAEQKALLECRRIEDSRRPG
jgi:hypothetical protein